MVKKMFFNKPDELKRNIYKILSEIELVVKDASVRKEITHLIDKISLINPKGNKAINTLMKDLDKLVRELKRELINPIDTIIDNYLNKIKELVNQIQYESE